MVVIRNLIIKSKLFSMSCSVIFFFHCSDGGSQVLAGCLRDFRNKPFPTRARIEYYQNTLTVFFHNGMTNNEQDYEACFRAENVILPSNGYFGISAATGGLADDHDVIHFLTSSLHSPSDQPSINQGNYSLFGQFQTKLLENSFRNGRIPKDRPGISGVSKET